MRSYWKRLSMYYMNLTGKKMDADILTDICNVCSDQACFSLVSNRTNIAVVDSDTNA
jgi:hypothetical protein